MAMGEFNLRIVNPTQLLNTPYPSTQPLTWEPPQGEAMGSAHQPGAQGALMVIQEPLMIILMVILIIYYIILQP